VSSAPSLLQGGEGKRTLSTRRLVSLHSHNSTGRLTYYGISLRARLVSTAISPASRCDCKRQQATAERSTAPYPKYLRSAGGIPTVLHIDGQWRSSWPTPQVAGVLEVSQLPGASETRTELLQSVVATSAAATPSEAACAKRHGRIKTDDCRHGASGSQFGEGRCSRRC